VKRRNYDIAIKVNGYTIKRVVIDPHYELKHSASIDDQIILRLVEKLDGRDFRPIDKDGPYLYFVNDKMQLGGVLSGLDRHKVVDSLSQKTVRILA
jgi:hypothetical protein